jgi:RimJ/RimL family protein N-acetyltransferase
MPMLTFRPITLLSSRLTLRWLSAADAPVLFTIFSDPEVMRYWSSPPMRDLSEATQMLLCVQAGYESGSALRVGIERKADGALLGVCSLFSLDSSQQRAEIGYALGRPFWGAGYMHEALQTFIDYAFYTLNLRRLEADIDPRNRASAKTVERLGFQLEGYLRERWLVNGELSDSALYGLLGKEWRKTT